MSNLKSQLEQFRDSIQNFQPIIGKTGGRYFGDQEKSYSLNTILGRLDSILEGNQLDAEKSVILSDIIDRVVNLDIEGDRELNTQIDSGYCLSLIIRIGTYIKQAVGVVFFNRTSVLESLRSRVVLLSSPASGIPSVPLTGDTQDSSLKTPVPTPADNPNPSSSSRSASVSLLDLDDIFGVANPENSGSGVGLVATEDISNPEATSLSTLPSFSQEILDDIFGIANPENSRSSVNVKAVSSNNEALDLPEEIRVLLESFKSFKSDFQTKQFAVAVPDLDWEKVEVLGGEESLFPLQHLLISIVRDVLTSIGFIIQENGLPKGIAVKSHLDIETEKQRIRKILSEQENWFLDFFTLLSKAGMAGYADQVRTFWAGRLNHQATKVAGFIPFDKYPLPYGHSLGVVVNQGERHEDVWTDAIRKGHDHYRTQCVERREICVREQWVKKHLSIPFNAWDLSELSKNRSLQKHILGGIQNTSQTSVAICIDSLKKMTLLDPKKGGLYQRELESKFPGDVEAIKQAGKTALDKRLELLSLDENYARNRKEAERLQSNLIKLYETLGKNKIHEDCIASSLLPPNLNRKDIIQELIRHNVINSQPDAEGYYLLSNGALAQCNFFGPLSSQITLLMQVAQSQSFPENRFVMRQLAPSLYASQSGNQNFCVGAHELPVLLRSEDLCIELMEKEKGLLKEWCGIEEGQDGKFSINTKKPNQFSLIADNTSDIGGLPKGPTMLSVLLDSIVSLGGKEWVSKFLSFAKEELGRRGLTQQVSTSIRFWDGTLGLDVQFQAAVSNPSITQSSGSSQAITPSQEFEYQNRRNALLQRFSERRLLVRVIQSVELTHEQTGAFSGLWKLNGGPNLSTTLIPRENIIMNLFLGGVRGVMLDPKTVTTEYFGNGFEHNGGTQMDNFANRLRVRPDGHSLDFVKETLSKESAEVEVGGRPSGRDHTEIAWFRPAERNLVQGLFFKINDQNFTTSLIELITLQKKLLDRYGLFFPIFAYKDLQFKEVIVDQELMRALALENQPGAIRTLSEEELARKEKHPELFFNIYGAMNTQVVLRGKEALKYLPPLPVSEEVHSVNYKKLFDFQLMVLQLKNASDTISFQRPDPQNFSQIKIEDLRVIDNLHVIFPSNAVSGNLEAKARDLFFSHSSLIRFLRSNSDHLRCWSEMSKRNMETFLGITLKENPTISVSFNRECLTHFQEPNNNDPHGMISYGKCVARLTQFLLLIDKKSWAKAIHLELRKVLGPDFGKFNGQDFFVDSPEIRNIDTLIGTLSDPNFFEVKPLPPPETGFTSNGSSVGGRISSRGPRPASLPVVNPPPMPLVSPFGTGRRRGMGISNIDPVIAKPLISTERQAELARRINLLHAQMIIGVSERLITQQSNLERLIGLLGQDGYKPSWAYNLLGAHTDALDREGAYASTGLNAKTIKVYVNKHLIQTAQVIAYLYKIALVTTKGDKNLLLPNGETAITLQNKHLYLTDEERRKKRAGLVVTGDVTVTAKGGYGSLRTPLSEKITVSVINTIAPQFEKYGVIGEELDVSDFIVKKGAIANPSPLFPNYYKEKTIPDHQTLENSWELSRQEIDRADTQGENHPILSALHEDDSLSLNAEVVRLRNGDFFLLQSYEKALCAYFAKLIIPAIKGIQKTHAEKRVYLKATAIGAGFFASLGMETNFQTSLKKYVYHSLLKLYKALIRQNCFERGTVIEFSFYQVDKVPEPLINAAREKGIQIVWQEKRDLLDFSPIIDVDANEIDPKLFHPIVLNAGDAFAWHGNEPETESVESALGNNSDSRLVFGPANPYLLDQSKWAMV